jgi:hypothetical protein
MRAEGMEQRIGRGEGGGGRGVGGGAEWPSRLMTGMKVPAGRVRNVVAA